MHWNMLMHVMDLHCTTSTEALSGLIKWVLELQEYGLQCLEEGVNVHLDVCLFCFVFLNKPRWLATAKIYITKTTWSLVYEWRHERTRLNVYLDLKKKRKYMNIFYRWKCNDLVILIILSLQTWLCNSRGDYSAAGVSRSEPVVQEHKRKTQSNKYRCLERFS